MNATLEQLVEELFQIIDEAPQDQMVPLLTKVLEGLVNIWIVEDKRLREAGDLKAECQKFFERAKLSGSDTDGWPHKFFNFWAMRSPNLFAIAYRNGRRYQKVSMTRIAVTRAANGRRLIGATSRNKVRAAAENFRHMSRDTAAYEIAEIVGLSSGTIRRYLSELFPGKNWSS